MKAFIDAANNSGKDINVPTKTTVLGVFDFRAFINMAMLLSENEKARALRQLMLDIVIDLINRKTGGGTKYINQRDKDFVFSSLQEDNDRRQFTDALKNYVEDDRYKYAHFIDLIYALAILGMLATIDALLWNVSGMLHSTGMMQRINSILDKLSQKIPVTKRELKDAYLVCTTAIALKG